MQAQKDDVVISRLDPGQNPNSNLGNSVVPPPAPPLSPEAVQSSATTGLELAVVPNEEEERLAKEFKVRNLINELLQTGNAFRTICQKLTGVFIRNYFLIAQHIPAEKLNEVILNFFILAAVPEKTGYKLESDPPIPSLQEIKLVEKESHNEILGDFFPQYDATQNKLVVSPAANVMLEEWGALTYLTVFYYGYIGLLGATVFEDKFVPSTDESRQEFLKSFYELFDKLLAHCDQDGLSDESKAYRRFMLVRLLVRNDDQWQSLVDKIVPKEDELSGVEGSEQQRFMQCLAENPYRVAKEIFNAAEGQRFMAEEYFTQVVTEVTIDKGNDNPIFQVMVAVMWAKNRESLKNGAYPNDFELVTQQTITPFQRIPRQQMLFASIKKIIEPGTSFFHVVNFLESEVSKLIYNINADVCVMVYRRDLFGTAIEQIDKILTKVSTSTLLYPDFVQIRAPYFVVNTRFVLSGGKNTKGYIDEGAVNVIRAMYNWLKQEFLFDTRAAEAALKKLQSKAVIKDESRLGLELCRLKTLAAERRDDIGERFFHDPSRIQFHDKRNKSRWSIKRSKVAPAKSPTASTQARAQAAEQPQTYYRGAWAPALPPPSPQKQQRTPDRQRRIKKQQKQSYFPWKLSRGQIVLAVLCGILFLLSMVALLNSLNSNQLPFDTTMFQLDFMQNFVESLAWSKDIFLSLFIVGTAIASSIIILAAVLLVIALVQVCLNVFSSSVQSTSLVKSPIMQKSTVVVSVADDLEDIIGDAYVTVAITFSQSDKNVTEAESTVAKGETANITTCEQSAMVP